MTSIPNVLLWLAN